MNMFVETIVVLIGLLLFVSGGILFSVGLSGTKSVDNYEHATQAESNFKVLLGIVFLIISFVIYNKI